MICQDRDWLGPSYKRLLIITFLKVYGENTSGKLFLEPDPPTCQIYWPWTSDYKGGSTIVTVFYF